MTWISYSMDKLKGLLATVLLFGACASAKDYHNTVFNNPDEIAAYISERVNSESIRDNAEFYGVILQDETGAYHYSVDKAKNNQGVVTFKFTRLENWQIVAFWHTHGKRGREKRYFSNYDTAVAKKFNVPVYMMDNTYTLRVFNPGDKTMSANVASRRGLGRAAGPARGTVVVASNKIAGL